MLREDAHSREWKYVANATALGARISQAKFFVLRNFLRKEKIYNKATGFERLGNELIA